MLHKSAENAANWPFKPNIRATFGRIQCKINLTRKEGTLILSVVRVTDPSVQRNDIGFVNPPTVDDWVVAIEG